MQLSLVNNQLDVALKKLISILFNIPTEVKELVCYALEYAFSLGQFVGRNCQQRRVETNAHDSEGYLYHVWE